MRLVLFATRSGLPRFGKCQFLDDIEPLERPGRSVIDTLLYAGGPQTCDVTVPRLAAVQQSQQCGAELFAEETVEQEV